MILPWIYSLIKIRTVDLSSNQISCYPQAMKLKSDEFMPLHSVVSDTRSSLQTECKANVPRSVRWMFRPVDVPNEAGLPETYPLLEVPDSLLIKLSFAAWFCFLPGIIGVFGWPILIAASILITSTIHLAVNQQNRIWRNADERFHRPHPPETIPPKCD